jgi:hypothetical protein
MTEDQEIVQEDPVQGLIRRVQVLEAKNTESVSHRMSYLTWCLANPGFLVVAPLLFAIFLEIAINNWSNTLWTLESLTKSVNWTIPILVSSLGLITAFGNKLYLIIQERGDMNLLAELRADINGLRREIEAKNKKADAEREKAEAKRDAEREKAEAKRDAEMASLIKELAAVKLQTARLETKIEKDN